MLRDCQSGATHERTVHQHEAQRGCSLVLASIDNFVAKLLKMEKTLIERWGVMGATFGTYARLAVIGAASLMAGSAFADTYYLTDDFGIQGKFRRCKYSNGKVYGLPVSEPACYDSIESGAASAPKNSVPAPDDGSSGGRTFRNCAEARAAGAAPVRRGDPGYSKKLDRDGDGIGCE
jgi:hypothetical protein